MPTSTGNQATFGSCSDRLAAGHPRPLLLGPDGSAGLLERPATVLLGVAPRPRGHHSVALGLGATVLLCIDGLIERRDATLDDGLARLLAVAPDLAARPVSELWDEILDRMAPDLTDDIALLPLRVRDGKAPTQEPRAIGDGRPASPGFLPKWTAQSRSAPGARTGPGPSATDSHM